MARVERLDVEGLELAIPLPAEARSSVATEVDLGVAPGLSLAEAEAWRWPGSEAQVTCVVASAWFWTPGLEGPVLDAASAISRKTLALPTLHPEAIRPGPPFEQNYSSDDTKGRHWLGFHGDDVVVCSLTCRGDACASLRDGAQMTSDEPPEPGAILSAATSLAARPRSTALAVSLLVVGVAAIVLWRRPRPEP